jgi:hypothetical protein
MEKVMWINRVKNEELLHIFKEESNLLRTLKERTPNWIGNNLVETAV